MSKQDMAVLAVTGGSLVVSFIAGTFGWALTSLKDRNVLSGVVHHLKTNQKDEDPEHEAGCARRVCPPGVPHQTRRRWIMMTIWKYQFEKGSNPMKFEMPSGAKVLDVQVQNGVPTLWALVNPNSVKETREFHYIGTGWDLEEHPGVHLGTFQLQDGSLVFHVFEKVTP